MTKFDICYSLNHQTVIQADSWAEAQSKLEDNLRNQGLNLKIVELEVFDVEEYPDDHDIPLGYIHFVQKEEEKHERITPSNSESE